MNGEQVKEGLRDAALRLGFMVHWQDDSRKVDTGWPDLLLVGHGTVIAVEAKSRGEKLRAGRVTRKGRQTPSQADWLEAIGGTPGCAAYVVRPFPEDVPALPIGAWEEIDYDRMLDVLRLVRDSVITPAQDRRGAGAR
jgi:hypothetical protein